MLLDYSGCWFGRIDSFFKSLKTNAMLQLFTTRTYQDRVDEIYKLLERDRGSLRLFEWRMRRIHCLNLKIKQRSADMGRKEEIY